ncbi:MAG: hypothetical protein LBJ63_00870 [Prevotellaceae bacterium]|jgi:hypothetical protein|nr:hypothetical protein [Prevotellaceae bacterium]
MNQLQLLFSRHCEKRSDEAIYTITDKTVYGLLRFARNDGKRFFPYLDDIGLEPVPSGAM